MGAFVCSWDGREYVPTGEDLLWMAVGIYGETRNKATLAECVRIGWTWINRFMLHSTRGKIFPTLAFLIKYHAQPVNPRWRLGGEFCPVVGPDGSNCSQSRLNWRAKMAGLLAAGYDGFLQVPLEIRDLSVALLNGCVPEPKSDDGSPLVDFGAYKFPMEHGTKYPGGDNWFISRDQWENTTQLMRFVPGVVHPPACGGGYYYEIEKPRSPLRILGGVVLAALAAYGVWFAATRVKRV